MCQCGHSRTAHRPKCQWPSKEAMEAIKNDEYYDGEEHCPCLKYAARG